MWSYVDGISFKVIDKKDETNYAIGMKIWDVSNLNILIWINNFVSQLIDMQLSKYDTAKEVRTIWNVCMLNLFLKNGNNWRMILELSNKIIWSFRNYIQWWVICGIRWLLWNRRNWKLSNRTLIKEKSNIWFNFWWRLGMILRSSVGVFCIVIVFPVLIYF